MSDIKLFRLNSDSVEEIDGHSVALEKSLQTQIENHLDTFLGVRFLATEHNTGVKHAGRIDTLGIDENGSPVVIEYKRALNENVITQGLYYLDWLMDHKAEFELLVQRKLGANVSDEIDWTTPRLLCIAGEFTKYDVYAVQQIPRNIELIRYRKYGGDLLLFEQVSAASGEVLEEQPETKRGVRAAEKAMVYKTFTEYLAQSSPELRDRYELFSAFATALGDDVQTKTQKYYAAFKRLKNFCCVEVHPKTNNLLLFLKVDPKTITMEPGFSRDVSDIGHFGTGDLELTIRSKADLEKAKPLIVQSYEAS
jgi:predicted transport protein